MAIEIMNLHKEQPSKPYDVIVDRTYPLGNPFVLYKECQRDEVCDKYYAYLLFKIAEKDEAVIKELNRIYILYMEYGKLRLFCWCAPKRCHAEFIKSIIIAKFKERHGILKKE